MGIAPITEPASPGSGTGTLPGLARAICACVLLAVAIVLAVSPRPGLAEPTVEEMIAEYRQLQQDQKRFNEIAENQENYSESEVQNAINQGELIGKILPGLKNEIKARDGKIPGEETTIRVSPGTPVSGTKDGEVKKMKAPAPTRPWKLGDWPWRFDSGGVGAEFGALEKKYYRLQAEMGAMLLIRRKPWTYKQATDYTGALSTLCARIIDIEERIAFGLGDPGEFATAIRGQKQRWNRYLDKQKITDAAEAVMNATAAEYYKLLEKSGLKQGDPVPSDDPNARQLNYLASRHKTELEHFEEVRKVSEKEKYESGAIGDAIKQRIKDGVAWTVKNPPKLEIHRLCKTGDSSLVYQMFLDNDQLKTFRKQSRLRFDEINR